LLVLTRAFFVNNEIYMAFVLNSQAQGVSGKKNNLPKHHSAGPTEARSPMQLHRLHRLKAGPGNNSLFRLSKNAVSNEMCGITSREF